MLSCPDSVTGVFEKLVGFYESEDEDTSKSSNDSGAKAKKSKK